MRLLLDTHAFLWWCEDDPRLGEAERAAIRDGANEVFLSAASVWEMAIKQALGRLQVPEPPSVAAPRMGIVPLPVALRACGGHGFASVSSPRPRSTGCSSRRRGRKA